MHGARSGIVQLYAVAGPYHLPKKHGRKLTPQSAVRTASPWKCWNGVLRYLTPTYLRISRMQHTPKLTQKSFSIIDGPVQQHAVINLPTEATLTRTRMDYDCNYAQDKHTETRTRVGKADHLCSYICCMVQSHDRLRLHGATPDCVSLYPL